LKRPDVADLGVVVLGTGSAVPTRVVTNAEIATVCDTNDQWIHQRTGIRERRICDPAKGEGNAQLCTEALRRALADAGVVASELDLIICGTITQDMRCPSTACVVGGALGATRAAAWDLGAACCGFVYPMNIAHDLIRVGSYRTIGVIGADCISAITDYSNRSVGILFGDAAGAAVLRGTEDRGKGVLAQVNMSDGSGWHDLYVPTWEAQVGSGLDRTNHRLGCLFMNGREVFRFAVGTFQELIAQTLTKGGVEVSDVDMFVCHQSNARIIEAAVERFGIPPDKVYINIDRYGNTSGGSVPLAFDELRKAGRIREGMVVMFVAFGAGLTWSSSLWQM
jgi:3-oxoacyl-[acyl-carrier-protein] synthase-3